MIPSSNLPPEPGAERTAAGGARMPPDPGELAQLHAVHAAARAAIARGWAVIPLRVREKAPAVANDWGHLTITAEQVVRHFTLLRGPDGQRAAPNLGVLTGAASGGLMDVDLDTPETVALANDLLPPTGLISGHVSKPASHRWYMLSAGATGSSLTRLAFSSLATPAHPATMLVELRGDGHQTMIPPSLHPSGEAVVWARAGEPGRADLGALRRAVAEVAAGAQLARAWPGQGLRDDVAVALCGMLARAGWEAERIDAFVCAVARVAGDEEWAKRGKGRGAAEQLAAGRHVLGGRRLAALLGPACGQAVVAKVREWLGMAWDDRPQPDHQIPHAAPVEPWHLGTLPKGSGRRHAIAEVAEQAVDAWFGGRLYGGMLNLLAGDPGLGKTLVALWLAACVSTGRAFPDGSPAGPRGAVVLYLSNEDDEARVLKPRLAAMAADLTRIFTYTSAIPLIDPATEEARDWAITFRDVDWLEGEIQATGARLVIFDPFMSYLPPGVNANADAEMRSVLTPLARLAERTGAAFLFVHHLNKSGMGRALYRPGGSIAIMAAMRSALLVARDPSDPERIVLASNKNNLGPSPYSLAFRVITGLGGKPITQWLGPVAYTADMLLANSDGAANRGEKMEAATDLLMTELANGPAPATVLEAKAKALDIGKSTLNRAKALLGVRATKRTGEEHGPWQWILPQDDQPRPDAPDAPDAPDPRGAA